MRVVVVDLLLVRSNVALAMTGKVLAPSALALFLLPELFLLCGLDLFGASVCVLFDA
jgi:hypothetical protein